MESNILNAKCVLLNFSYLTLKTDFIFKEEELIRKWFILGITYSIIKIVWPTTAFEALSDHSFKIQVQMPNAFLFVIVT